MGADFTRMENRERNNYWKTTGKTRLTGVNRQRDLGKDAVSAEWAIQKVESRELGWKRYREGKTLIKGLGKAKGRRSGLFEVTVGGLHSPGVCGQELWTGGEICFRHQGVCAQSGALIRIVGMRRLFLCRLFEGTSRSGKMGLRGPQRMESSQCGSATMRVRSWFRQRPINSLLWER